MVAGMIGLIPQTVLARGIPQKATIQVRHPSGRMTTFHLYGSPTRARAAGPLIVFSHGAGSRGNLYEALFEPWVREGAVVVAPDHVTGSDRMVDWRNRCEDLVLAGAPEQWSESLPRGWAMPFPSDVVVAGHSYGAVSALAVCGAEMGAAYRGNELLTQAKALITLSPPGALPGMVPSGVWETIRLPSLLQYGDADVIPGFMEDVRTRHRDYRPVDAVPRWLSISEGADHTFGGLICDREPGPLAQEQIPALEDLGRQTSAFIDAFARNRPSRLEAETRQSGGRFAPADDPALRERVPWLRLQKHEKLGPLRLWNAAKPKAVIGFLPGFGCEARRYDWLGGLTQDGLSVVIPELSGVPGLAGFDAFVAYLRSYGVPIVLMGHSAGGALVLDGLETDPMRNHILTRPERYQPPSDIAGVAILGASLQPQMFATVLAHRQEDTPLTRQGDQPLLFLSGSHDDLAWPVRVAATAARYRGAVEHRILPGGTHYGFAAGQYRTDNPAADRAGGLPGRKQRQQISVLLNAFCASLVQP